LKKTLLAAGFCGLMSTTAVAETVGVSIYLFDDVWTTVMRTGLTDHADTLDGVDVQVEDALDDVARQLDQINNFIASGVDAIVVQPVDTSATQAMSDAAEAAGVPLVYVNRQPINLDTLPDNQAFVASNEIESGMCNFIEIVDKQTSNWQRDQAQDLMTNWISSGEDFDVVFANNDESAIGAIQAMKAAGISMDDVVVVGVDATQDALVSMQAGDLDATVFQDAAGQGAGSLDTALRLARGEEVDNSVFIPFVLVTPDNMDEFLDKN